MKFLYLVQIVQDIKDGGGSKPDTWLNCLRFEKKLKSLDFNYLPIRGQTYVWF